MLPSIMPMPHGKRSGAVGLFAGAVLVVFVVAPRFEGHGLGDELAMVVGIALALTGLVSWQRNAMNPKRDVARLERERRRRERAERKG